MSAGQTLPPPLGPLWKKVLPPRQQIASLGGVISAGKKLVQVLNHRGINIIIAAKGKLVTTTEEEESQNGIGVELTRPGFTRECSRKD